MRDLHPARRPFPAASRLALVLLLGAFWACSPGYPPPPETKRIDVVESLHGVEFQDSYRWLEDQTSEDTRAWVASQNAYAESIIGESPLRDEIRRRLEGIVDVEVTGAPQRAGGFEYSVARRKGEELPVIRRRRVSDGKEPVRIDTEEAGEVVLDPHGLSPDHTIRADIHSLSEDGKWMVYSLRDGGRDEVELRTRDLGSGRDLAERYPAGLYDQSSFAKDGRGFYYVLRSRQDGPRVYFHKIGAPPDEDVLVFGGGIGPASFLRLSQAADDRYLIFSVQHGWASNEIHFRDTRSGRTWPVVGGLDAHFEARYHEGRLLVRTDYEAPGYRIVSIDPLRPEPEHWLEIVPEGPGVLQRFTLIEERIYAGYLHDASSRIRVFELDGADAGEIAVPEFHTAQVRGASKGKAFLSLSSFTRPETEYLYDLETGEREFWQGQAVDFPSEEYTVRQVWYESKDGTRVPMFLVHREGIELDGSHPALLHGYGGFNSPLTPRFSPRAAVWLEQGGVFAAANLRGGSEFGEAWHRGGMLENKQNVFDDFLAAAGWLIAEGYTRPDRLAAYGGSNGGLLVAAALTQRPDLFRAVLCAFPDLDMVRFHTFTGNNNMPALLEYGDASDPAQFEFLRAYSPYQQVRDGVHYPAVMLTTGGLDTRVPPLQARKMTARLQAASASGLPVILRHDPKGGHAAGRGRPVSKVIADTAGELTFLLTQLGAPSR